MTDSTNETLGEEIKSWVQTLVSENLPNIKSAVSTGLTEIENQALIEFAAELIKLAEVHDSEAFEKVKALL